MAPNVKPTASTFRPLAFSNPQAASAFSTVRLPTREFPKGSVAETARRSGVLSSKRFSGGKTSVLLTTRLG